MDTAVENNEKQDLTKTNIQWYPGHMTKTKRRIKEILPMVDAVAEIVDARIPTGSRNPDLDLLTENKPRVILLNKADTADGNATAQWVAHIRASEGKLRHTALAVDCRSGHGLEGFMPALRGVLSEKIEAWRAKGMTGRAIRIMVAGIPNCGKSSFINRMAKTGKAKVEDRPGVTRGNQWFSASDGTLMLDTPGVLWPKFEDQTVARHLAFTGAIRDEILDSEELACALLGLLADEYPRLLTERYKLEGELPEEPWELLKLIGKKRGMLISGGETDTERASAMLLDEFRGGKIGRITLERCGKICE